MKLIIVTTLLVNCVLATAEKFNSDAVDYTAGLGQEGRISNGEEAQPKQFPYQVGLHVYFQIIPIAVWCGGIVISNQWILTAAHCTIQFIFPASHMYVHLGALNRSDISEIGHKVIRVPKENIFRHEEYNLFINLNDIALVKLPDPVELNDYIQPVQLPLMGESSSYAGEKAIASGWGMTSDADNTGSDILLWIEVPIIKNNECKKVYKRLRASHICFDTKNKKSACEGDSGGPLVLADESKTLIGIASYRKGSCEMEYPVVYVRVTSYLDWIKINTGISNELEK